ncbi:metallophosphoesterase, partial [Myxococcota bacterium]|nr:metallophosphoesterase [Myxococcota bacterium]
MRRRAKKLSSPGGLWNILGIGLMVVGLFFGCDAKSTTNPGNDAGSDADSGADIVVDADADADVDSITPECSDECETPGARACHEGAIRECGHYDEDSCLEWSAPESCVQGYVCDPGTVSCVEACGDFCEPFSIVVLPDTQYYTSKQANNSGNTYRKQMQWILDHRDTDDIRFVVHLGDITNNNTTSQWQIASDAHAMLDAADMPYSVVTGNHDYLVGGVFDRGGSLINDYFPPSRFSTKPWYGGAYGNSSANNHAYFQVGDMKFLVVSIEYAPRKDVLCWADNLIASHPDHHVILITHCYLTHGGGYSGSCPDPDYDAIGAPGQTTWDELVSRHSNLFLVISGHVGDSEYRVRTSNTGYAVHEMLVDYQFEGECSAASASQCTNNCRTGIYHGNGWMRQLIFDPRQTTIHSSTLTVEDGNTTMFPAGQPAFFCSELFDPPSPDATGGNWYASDPSSPTHQFSFSHDFVSPPGTGHDDLCEREFLDRTVNSAGAGQQLVPVVAMAPDDSFVVVWEDDSDAADGAGNHDIFARIFAPGGCQAVHDFRVHTDGAGQQQSPSVAMDDSGNFVVVWADDTDGNGIFQVRARGFNADGTERFAAFTVNSVPDGQQLNPAVAMAPDGRFVVVWEDDPLRDGNTQVLMRGFHPNGSQLFADRSVHDDSAGPRKKPSIGMDGLGNIVVVWADDSDGNGSYQIHGRGFNADGSDRLARFTVNSVSTGQQVDPDISMAADGRFVVVWRDDVEAD